MDAYLPPFVEAERNALLAEIEEAFDGVGRMGGVSWSQSEVLDMYGSQEDMENARRNDRDFRWQDLLAPGAWEPEPGIGGFSFLDPIGFRYYLPAAMTLSVRQGYDTGILFHLQLFQGDLQAHMRSMWSELDARQARCVRRFLDYMLVSQGLSGSFRRDEVLAALDGYWREVAEEGVGEAGSPKRAKRKRGPQERG